MSITEVTRHHILDYLRGQSEVVYHGKMDELEFLKRVFDLSKVRSDDKRCSTYEADISTHRYHFKGDWDDDWIYTDVRFDLAKQPDEVFLKFLCQMLHPLTNREGRETVKLLGVFNKFLGADGHQIGRAGEISRKPYYGPVPYGRTKSGLGKVKKLGLVLNAVYISRQVDRIENSVDDDPELAIGTAKEFIESVCKTILAERGLPVTGSPDIPTLTKLTFNELKLLPDASSSRGKGTEVTKRLLSNLASVIHGITELRGLYGTGHGKDANTTPIDPRHARLVAGAATTLATFLFETHKACPPEAQRDGSPLACTS